MKKTFFTLFVTAVISVCLVSLAEARPKFGNKGMHKSGGMYKSSINKGFKGSQYKGSKGKDYDTNYDAYADRENKGYSKRFAQSERKYCDENPGMISCKDPEYRNNPDKSEIECCIEKRSSDKGYTSYRVEGEDNTDYEGRYSGRGIKNGRSSKMFCDQAPMNVPVCEGSRSVNCCIVRRDNKVYVDPSERHNAKPKEQTKKLNKLYMPSDRKSYIAIEE